MDWGHPISQRMWCAYLFNERSGLQVYDACGRAGTLSLVSVTAMPAWTALGLQCGNSKGYAEGTNQVKSSFNPVAADYTVRIRHVPRNWPGTYTTPLDICVGGTRYLSLFENGSQITYNQDGGKGGSSSQPTGELSDFIWVRRLKNGTSTNLYYRNGKFQSSESGPTGTSWPTTGYTFGAGGNPSTGGSPYDGCYHIIEIWERELRVSEIQELWADPYCNIDKGQLRLWSVPKGGVFANAQSFSSVVVSAPTASATGGGVHNYLYIAGFDSISATSEITTYLNMNNWVGGAALNTNTAHTPFNSGQSIVDASGQLKLIYTFPAVTAKAIVGFYFKNRLTGQLSGTLIQFIEGSTNQLWLGFQSGNTGKLELRRGNSSGTLLGTTATAVITNLTFAHIELKVKISDSIASGDVVLYVDGVSVMTLSAATDTQNSANAYVDSFSIGSADISCYVDDLFIVDWTIGNTGQVGVCRVYYFTPNGNGATNDFTPSSGSNYQNVDETPNSTSDYNSDATAGHIDLYDYTNFTSQPNSVKVVQLNNLIASMDAGTRTVRGLVRLSGTNYEGPNIIPIPSYRYHSTIFLANPQTNLQWAYGDINVVQAGLKIQS